MTYNENTAPSLTEEILFASPMAKVDRQLRKLDPYSRVETEYPGILRGPSHRWWKPVLALILAGFLYLLFSTLVTLPIFVETIIKIGSASEGGNVTLASINDLGKRLENAADPFGIATALISIACFIPAVVLANLVVFRARPGMLGSVVGNLRWGLLCKYLAVILVPYMVFLLGVPLAIGEGITINPKPTFWISLIILLIFTPLQAAAEEYMFRGWLLQIFGSWFKSARLAWLVLSPLSVGIFVFAHAAGDIYINIQLGIFAIAAMALLWRTGGLEAGIALHAVNNTILFILDALSGGTSNSSPRTQTSDLTETCIFLVFLVLVTAILWAVFSYGEKHSHYRRYYQPVPIPTPIWESYQRYYAQQFVQTLPVPRS